jgi:hypothetical protein
LGGIPGAAPYWCRLPASDRRWHWLWMYQAQAALRRASLALRCPVLAFSGGQPHIYLVLSILRPRLSTGGGGEQSRASVFAGHHRRAVGPLGTGLFPPQHSSSDPGQF